MSVNSGSSSLKFQISLEMPQQEVIVSGLVERIGSNQAVFTMKTKDKKDKQVLEVLNHQTAVELLLDALIQKKLLILLEEIEGVGQSRSSRWRNI
ncbi:hypothetical protein ACEW7V_02870 [Areca yellow leaf disease phytoplasma]|uniref:hypothetical protein n=1 Tax=Areca yellow leaf disease phytoplasma TaxID=927614 RepID=UPI0035B50554